MKRQREQQPVSMMKRRHRWVAALNERPGAIERCGYCGTVRAHGGWYDRWGEWHEGATLRCGETRYG